MPGYLSFGVPSLDELFGEGASRTKENNTPTNGVSKEQSTKPGILIPGCNESSQRSSVSVCISGPDGTGKSILGMHLASRYLADCQAQSLKLPKVLYVSTDLKFEMAEKMWFNFGLDYPNQRVVPFTQATLGKADDREIKVTLSPCSPLDSSNTLERSNPLAERLVEEQLREVLFVDLAAVTVGDDWGFVNRMLSVLAPPQSGEPCHLLVIDSVEGFETLVGNRDAFGEAQERRSRIAQMMRSAANKCHTLFIVEEPEEGKRLPEEFVTDVVIRLRSQMVKGYVRRTLEIEKARGHSHVRGQHAYMIRPGRGSTTGRQENHDEPAIPALASQEERAKTQSYLHVCHSLHYLNREIMTMTGKGRPANLPEYYAAFGIRYLDEMLERGKTLSRPHRVNGNDWRGLRSSTTTALIGNSDTQKSPLGVAFLARCFRAYAARLHDELKKAQKDKETNSKRFSDDLKRAQELAEIWKKRIDRKPDRRKKRYPSNNIERQAEILCRLSEITPVTNGDGEYIEQPSNSGFTDLLKVAVFRLGPPKAESPIAAKDAIIAEKTDAIKAGDGIPVLLTTQDVHAQELAYKFLPWLKRKVPGLKDYQGGLTTLRLLVEEYTICRRLEIHDLPSAVFFHIVQCAVRAAQTMLYPGSLLDPEVKKVFEPDWDTTQLAEINGVNEADDEPLRLRELSRLYEGDYLSEETETRFQQSWAIRVVIEDFSILKNTYVEIRDEPLLLRFLIFYLGREGVTTLLIDTQPGQPDTAVASPLDSELRSLVDNHLYTWRFSFYGETRVAIAAIPPISTQSPAVVRELRESRDKHLNEKNPEVDILPLIVDPHFELYSGIEKGEPKPVPLEIRLFAETESFRRYVEQENIYFRELFTPVNQIGIGELGDVIIGVPAKDYDRLRDFCYLQRDTRLDHTVLFQVDEFWHLRRQGVRRAGTFRPQAEYLNAVTASWMEEGTPGDGRWVREWATDPFGLFQATVRDEEKEKGRENAAGPTSDNIREDKRRQKYLFRWEHFATPGYLLNNSEAQKQRGINNHHLTRQEESSISEESIDRVPFMWDFGFLLCRQQPWQRCREASLEIWNNSHETDKRYVRDVWDYLPRALERQGSDSVVPAKRPSWRLFMEACYQVGRAESYRIGQDFPPFDLHVVAAQTLACLILEIWASEIYCTLHRQGQLKSLQNLVEQLSRRYWKHHSSNNNFASQGLISWLDENNGFRLELFKAWLLIIEVMDLDSMAKAIRDGVWDNRPANSNAIATRHWYKTACHATNSISPSDPVIAVGLPGHFSMRGDWFLAVAGTSRSSRLADRALDLLNSRRANHVRLREGLGLPVRKIHERSGLKTGLMTVDLGHHFEDLPDDLRYRTSKVTYENLLKLGDTSNENHSFHSANSEDAFYWLWRSGLDRYYRHTKIWQDWLNDTVLWWERWRYLRRSNWVNGFKRYDMFTQDESTQRVVCEAWKRFDDSCQDLLQELKEATRLALENREGN